MGYHLLINGLYWGYNPLTYHLLTSWDIQAVLPSGKPTWLAGKWILNEDGKSLLNMGDSPACYVWSIPEGKWNDLVHHPIETSIYFNNFFQVPGFLPISIISLPPTKSAKLPWCWTTGSSPVIGRWGPNWKLLYGDGRTRCAGNFDGKKKPKMDGFCVKLGGIPDVFL